MDQIEDKKRFFVNSGLNRFFPQREKGFTLIEVLTAASIMIILCVGTVSVFAYAIKINIGNNMRSQALTVLQAEAEYYRSLKFVPGTDVTAPELYAGTYNRGTRESADHTSFTVTVTITNKSYLGTETPAESTCTLKEITINTVMTNPQPGWLANLQTNLTILRVRSN